MAPNGEVFVADTQNNRIQVFTPEGGYLRQWAGSSYPRKIAVDASGVYVTTDTGVMKYSHSAQEEWSVTTGDWFPFAMTVQGGIVYTGLIKGTWPDQYYKVARYSSDDGSSSGADWSLGPVTALAPAPNGDVFVGNYWGNPDTVKRVNSAGVITGERFLTQGSEDLAADSEGGLVATGDVAHMRPAPFHYLPPGATQARDLSLDDRTSFTALAFSPSGRYLYAAAVVTYPADGSVQEGSRILRFDVGVPDVKLTPDDAEPLTGREVQFTATASVPIGRVVQYDWDLDGDGTFESTTATPEATRIYNDVGSWTARVRATTHGGSSTTAETSVRVFAAPPDGEAGVSINQGDAYTNNKNVTLDLVWPARATEARISNDGGFAAARTTTVTLDAQHRWTLDDSVEGRNTKVVYVRFKGSGIDERQTYSDDIILDTAPPVVTDAAVTAGGGSQATATTVSSLGLTGKGSAKYRVRVKARDKLTGVRLLQVNVTKRATTARTLRYRPRVSLSLPKSTTVHVRVRDGAGNWTKWRTIRVR